MPFFERVDASPAPLSRSIRNINITFFVNTSVIVSSVDFYDVRKSDPSGIAPRAGKNLPRRVQPNKQKHRA